MVDTMTVLGTAATAKLAGDRLVRDLVAYIRETTSTMQFTIQSSTNPLNKRQTRRPRKGNRLSRPMKPTTSGLGRRPSSYRSSNKVSTMTDAELEAELDARRRRRAKERDAYSRAMRSDKLAALEHELDSLRREIGRLDAPHTAVSMAPRPAGTPPNARWEPLPRSRRPPSHGSTTSFPHQAGAPAAAPTGSPNPSMKAGGPLPPPPPPPMPPMPPMASDHDDGSVIDPEKQKREKLERQKRREAKKKEREQNQKKMTLADIIRSAGPDPIRGLKPMTRKPADQEKEDWEKAKREREEREARQEAERIEKERKDREGSRRASESLKTGDVNDEEKESKQRDSEQKEGDGKREDKNGKSVNKEVKREEKSIGDQTSEKDTTRNGDRDAKAMAKSSTGTDNDTNGKSTSEKKGDPIEGKEDRSDNVSAKLGGNTGEIGNEACATSDEIEESPQQPKEDIALGRGAENVVPNVPPLPPGPTMESKKANAPEDSVENKVSTRIEASS